MMKIWHANILFVCLCIPWLVRGQDSQFSQMETMPMLVNPATTGLFTNNDINLGAQYRNQWSSLSSSINTFALSFDMPMTDRWSLGGFLKNTDEIGIINTFNVVASGSYIITNPRNRYYVISAGLQIGMIYKRINTGKLTFDSQYDQNYFNTDLPSGENFIRQNTFIPDANLGFYYRNINQKILFNPYVGLSVFHIFYAKETFIDGSEGRLPLRYVGNAGTGINFNQDFNMEVNLYYQRQRDFNQWLVNVYAKYNIDRSEYQVIGGFGYRVGDAIIMHAGFKHGYNTFRFSYDFNISDLKTYTRNRGAIEFSILYVAGRKKGKITSRF
jgi:type IX secretion system PorP/SprF family membrane protein